MPIFTKPKPQLKPITINLDRCARCGQPHTATQFKQLTQPMTTPSGDTLTHWALCPTSGEPVLLKVEAAKAENGNG